MIPCDQGGGRGPEPRCLGPVFVGEARFAAGPDLLRGALSLGSWGTVVGSAWDALWPEPGGQTPGSATSSLGPVLGLCIETSEAAGGRPGGQRPGPGHPWPFAAPLVGALHRLILSKRWRQGQGGPGRWRSRDQRDGWP